MAAHINKDNPKIRRFLEAHAVGTLATANKNGLPHATAMYFVVDPDFTVYFITKEQTTSHENIQQNPDVALAVFDAASQTTVQVFGSAEVVDDRKTFRAIYAQIFGITRATSGNHQPPINKIEAGKSVLYRIDPKIVRMAEFVKAEYPPVDELFETVHGSTETLEESQSAEAN